MEKEEIISILKNFDLSEYESKTYCSLVSSGPSKVSEISRDSQVPQAKVYETLERLMKKQLVEILNVTPKKFKAVAPDIALRDLVDEKQKHLDVLKSKVEIVSDVLKPFKQEEVFEGIWTQEGNKWAEFINRQCEMFERTEKYAYLVARDFTWTSRLAEILKNCYKRGVKIRTVTIQELDNTTRERAKWFHDHAGVEIRVFKTDIHPRIIAIDGREILLRLDKHPTKRERFSFTSIWSKDPSLVKVIDGYAKNLWKIAKSVRF
jgi:sugar-specific transcriptional regulator TrmB